MMNAKSHFGMYTVLLLEPACTVIRVSWRILLVFKVIYDKCRSRFGTFEVSTDYGYSLALGASVAVNEDSHNGILRSLIMPVLWQPAHSPTKVSWVSTSHHLRHSQGKKNSNCFIISIHQFSKSQPCFLSSLLW